MFIEVIVRLWLQDIEAANSGSTRENEVPDEEEAEVDVWSAVLWLAALTVFIAILSQYIVDAIEVRCTTLLKTNLYILRLIRIFNP